MAILAVLVSYQPSYMAMASVPPPVLCHSSHCEVGGGPSPCQHLIPWISIPNRMVLVFLTSLPVFQFCIQFISLALISRVLGQVPINEAGLRDV